MQSMDHRYPTLHAMIAALAAADPDGARDRNDCGFSAAHVRQGHRLAQYEYWNAEMAADAWNIVRCYRRTQLAGWDWFEAEDEGESALAEAARWQPAPAAEAAEAHEAHEAVAKHQPSPDSVYRLLGPDGPIARALPGYEARAPQIAMAETITTALAANRDSVIEAATGTGKGFAYLAAMLAAGKSAIISTAGKSLQDQLANDDLPFLQRYCGTPFQFAVLKGRSNYLCLDRVNQIAARQADKREAMFRSPEAAASWPALVAWQSLTNDGDLDAPTPPLTLPAELRGHVTVGADECHGQDCKFYTTCYAQLARARARDARFVVVNHTLLLLSAMLNDRTSGQVELIPPKSAIVIDECHRLPEVASDVYGHSFTERALARLAAPLQQLTVDLSLSANARIEAGCWLAEYRAITQTVRAALEQLATRLVRDGDSTSTLGDERPLLLPAATLMVALADRMENEIPDWLTTADDRNKWLRLARLLSNHAATLRAVATPSEGQVARFIRRDSDSGVLELCANPIDVTEQLRGALWERNDPQTGQPLLTVSTSATIAAGGALDYWCERVGLSDAHTAILSSPFDYPRIALLYIPADGPAFDPATARGDQGDRVDAYLQRMAAEIEVLVQMSGGGALLLFTSRRMLREMVSRLQSRLSRYTVLVQGETPPDDLIRRFKTDGNAVLFGLRRFWEGVSIDGPALRLTVIDKLPFPTPSDPIYAARSRAIENATGDRWAGLTRIGLPEATITLKQGVGRLIRRASDYGVVALLDGRLRTKRYGRQIIADLPPFRLTSDRQTVVGFFAERGHTAGGWR